METNPYTTRLINKVKEVSFYNVQIPLVHPFRTSFGLERIKNAILVKTVDAEGNVGWGETTVMDVPSYCYETVDTAWIIQNTFLIKTLKKINEKELSIGKILEKWKPIRGHEFAKGGIEAALWALIAEQKNKNLGELYGATKKKIPTGVSIGIQENVEDLLERINMFLSRGYQRIKMKIEPGWDVDIVRRVREEFPNIQLMVDANSAYSLSVSDIEIMKELDKFDLMMIEQPLAYNDILAHKKLQEQITTPVCLDESIHDPMGAELALEFECCKIINIKPGRMGGFANSIRTAQLGGKGKVWCGGMLETGIGRLHNIYFQARDEFILPGDTSGSDRYFEKDLIDPPVKVDTDGFITLPEGKGLGHKVLENRIENYATEVLSYNI